MKQATAFDWFFAFIFGCCARLPQLRIIKWLQLSNCWWSQSSSINRSRCRTQRQAAAAELFLRRIGFVCQSQRAREGIGIARARRERQCLVVVIKVAKWTLPTARERNETSEQSGACFVSIKSQLCSVVSLIEPDTRASARKQRAKQRSSRWLMEGHLYVDEQTSCFCCCCCCTMRSKENESFAIK